MYNLDVLKQKIIDTSQKMANAKMAPGTWGNISARDPNTGYIAITPSGMDYSKLKVEDICVIDINQNIIESKWKPSTETPLHALFYREKPEVSAIVHTHSIYATAFACAGKPIPAVIETLASVVGGSVPVAPYHLPGDEDFARNALKAMEDKAAVLLRNHGVVTVGKDLDEAYMIAEVVENAAKIYIAANSIGTPMCLDEKEIKALRQIYLTKYGQK